MRLLSKNNNSFSFYSCFATFFGGLICYTSFPNKTFTLLPLKLSTKSRNA